MQGFDAAPAKQGLEAAATANYAEGAAGKVDEDVLAEAVQVQKLCRSFLERLGVSWPHTGSTLSSTNSITSSATAIPISAAAVAPAVEGADATATISAATSAQSMLQPGSPAVASTTVYLTPSSSMNGGSTTGLATASGEYNRAVSTATFDGSMVARAGSVRSSICHNEPSSNGSLTEMHHNLDQIHTGGSSTVMNNVGSSMTHGVNGSGLNGHSSSISLPTSAATAALPATNGSAAAVTIADADALLPPGIHLFGLRKVFRKPVSWKKASTKQAATATSTGNGIIGNAAAAATTSNQGPAVNGSSTAVAQQSLTSGSDRASAGWLSRLLQPVLRWYRGDEFVAVAGTWLSISPGQCFCLLGPNGAGKTTTIKCITGVSRVGAVGAVL